MKFILFQRLFNVKQYSKSLIIKKSFKIDLDKIKGKMPEISNIKKKEGSETTKGLSQKCEEDNFMNEKSQIIENIVKTKKKNKNRNLEKNKIKIRKIKIKYWIIVYQQIQKKKNEKNKKRRKGRKYRKSKQRNKNCKNFPKKIMNKI